ncbi:MAG: hypothetical protein KDD65_04815 [Bacteroidetes bacterium]|nr:hypothetical protein [Bacteroidota bacterium]
MKSLNWDDVDPARLPGDLREIACDCGLDVAQYLVEMWGGAMIYVPTLRTLKKEYRDHVILEEFDGSNVGALASKLGVSRRYVQQVVRSQNASEE